MGKRWLDEAKEWGGTIAAAGVFYVAFNTLAFAAYHVPSESMLPTLTVGDHFYAAKFAYGYSRFSPTVELPGGDGRLMGRMPERGDVIVFRHPQRDEDLVKRVIGLPGDEVQVKRGRLHINGQVLERRPVARYAYRQHTGGMAEVIEFVETLPEGREHRILERTDTGPADDTPVFRVPDGHLFMMGDNRDNSDDSRFQDVGFVPFDRVLARADLIAFAWSGCTPADGLECPGGVWSDRLMRGVE